MGHSSVQHPRAQSKEQPRTIKATSAQHYTIGICNMKYCREQHLSRDLMKPSLLHGESCLTSHSPVL